MFQYSRQKLLKVCPPVVVEDDDGDPRAIGGFFFLRAFQRFDDGLSFPAVLCKTRTELLQVFKSLIVPGTGYEFQPQFIAVDVLVEVKEVDLDGFVLIFLKGRAVANVKHTAVLLAFVVGIHSVDAGRGE